MKQSKQEHRYSFEETNSGMSSDWICCIMQQIGLPALRIAPETMEVTAFNRLFADLIASRGIGDYRLWFVDGVLPSMNEDERAGWVAAVARFEPAGAHVRFELRGRRKRDFEMRSNGKIQQETVDPLIACVFIPSSAADSGRKDRSGFARGQAMERSRIRDELHKNVSQKLLGAAFGCKVLAGKIERLDEGFAREASDLAQLLNTAVIDLQNLTRRSEDCG
jgi:Histidine kinase